MALSPKAIELLRTFRKLGNAGDLHPLDRERWRKFVIQAHLDGGEISDTEVAEVLSEEWVRDVAVELGGEYYEERQLLNAYDRHLGRSRAHPTFLPGFPEDRKAIVADALRARFNDSRLFGSVDVELAWENDAVRVVSAAHHSHVGAASDPADWSELVVEALADAGINVTA